MTLSHRLTWVDAMPSPFPGMDPYIESQEWEDFHSRINNAMADVISEKIRPAYVVRIERRVYVEIPGSESENFRIADLAVIDAGEGGSFGGSGAVATAPEARQPALRAAKRAAATA